MAYCIQCGSPIPDDDQRVCSMCYGDPHYGSDGYYLEAQEREEAERWWREEIEYWGEDK